MMTSSGEHTKSGGGVSKGPIMRPKRMSSLICLATSSRCGRIDEEFGGKGTELSLTTAASSTMMSKPFSKPSKKALTRSFSLCSASVRLNADTLKGVRTGGLVMSKGLTLGSGRGGARRRTVEGRGIVGAAEAGVADGTAVRVGGGEGES